MIAPTRVALTDDQPWVAAPMPGSDRPLDLIRLDSAPGRFTIYARFPAGFARHEPGGYRATEEFLVLDGELKIDGATYRRGDLTVVPANYRRGSMGSPTGCRVLAWFDGRADFLPEDELAPCCEPVVSVRVGDTGLLVSAPAATWRQGAGHEAAMMEVVSADLDLWERGVGMIAGPGDLVRQELP